MKDVVKVLKEKVEKHESKLKAHKETEVILEAEYKDQKDKDAEKASFIQAKLFSTIKNIEYHKATAKTYKKVIAILEQKL